MSDYLSEELIFEIFTRLPPKSLLRFRSLSKSWYSSIYSPHFIRTHTSRSPQKLLIKHRHLTEKNSEFNEFYTLHSEDQFPLCPRRGYFGITPVEYPYKIYNMIVGSCNGILCVLDYIQDHISLWNPLVRRKLELPDCPESFRRFGMGFGFDPITNDYKIVILFLACLGFVVSSFAYSMKTGGWCEIAVPSRFISIGSFRACFVNGALHWVVCDSYESERLYILTFDLSNNVFGEIEFPETSWKISRLTTIQGSLAVIYSKDDNTWIWVRRDASWSAAFEPKANISKVFHQTSNGDLLSNIADEVFQVYNPKTEAQSRLVNFADDSCTSKMETCVESLELLDMGLPTS